MTRFALIAVLAALPFAAVAAPVPAPVPKPFGAAGLVSVAELESLRFDSRPVPAAESKRDRVERVKRVVEIQKRVQVEDVVTGPPKVRPSNRFDVAVHMPVSQFKVGDPIPAFFVVRNNRAEDLDLDVRLDFDVGAPAVNTDCDLRLTDARTGKPAGGARVVKTIKCGGLDMLVIPADGFYCAKGDLGPLPAGVYQLDWRCGEFRSAPVQFRVFDRDGPQRVDGSAPRAGYQFFRLADDYTREREAREEGPNDPVRQYVALDPIDEHEMAAALASGSATESAVFVPDVRDIPARDPYIVVSVDWHPYRSGDRIVVTLRAAHPYKTVRFDELPHLHLQTEVYETRERSRKMLDAVSKKLEQVRNLATPLTIEAHFPEGWREALGSGETARVAVMVTAREVLVPSDGLRKAVDKVRFEGNPECPSWAGIVRSDFAELRLPPPIP